MQPLDRKIYTVLAFLSLASVIWLAYQWQAHDHNTATLCMFKNITGLPCPSCGITRSVLLLLQGFWHQAWLMNPLGYVAAILLVTIPLWISIDLIRKGRSLVAAFWWTEAKIKNHKLIYVPLIALMLINWAWNILKGL